MSFNIRVDQSLSQTRRLAPNKYAVGKMLVSIDNAHCWAFQIGATKKMIPSLKKSSRGRRQEGSSTKGSYRRMEKAFHRRRGSCAGGM